MGQMIPKEMKYNLHYGKVRGDVLPPPHDTNTSCSVVKLEFTGVFIIFLISAQKHKLWEVVRTASSNEYPQSMFEQKYENY